MHINIIDYYFINWSIRYRIFLLYLFIFGAFQLNTLMDTHSNGFLLVHGLYVKKITPDWRDSQNRQTGYRSDKASGRFIKCTESLHLYGCSESLWSQKNWVKERANPLQHVSGLQQISLARFTLATLDKQQAGKKDSEK